MYLLIWKKIVVLVFVNITMKVSYGEVTIRPENVAVVAGSQTVIRCQTDLMSVVWHHSAPGLNNFLKIYNRFAFITDYKYRYELHSVGGVFELVINLTQPIDAGTYMCQEPKTLKSSSSELIVLQSVPMFSSNLNSANNYSVVEHDLVELVCGVNYSGNWAPLMKWQQVGQGLVITDGVVNNTVPYKSLTYTLTVNATRDVNANKYSCTTYFSQSNKPMSVNTPGLGMSGVNSEANNLPNFTHKWLSEVNVLFGVRNLTITPTGSFYLISDNNNTLTCSASGNPRPVFHWTDLDTGNTVMHGDKLLLSAVGCRTPTPCRLECTASNRVLGVMHNASVNITIRATYGGKSNLVLAGATTGLILVTVGILALVIVVVKKHKQDVRRTAKNGDVRERATDNVQFECIGSDGTVYAQVVCESKKLDLTKPRPAIQTSAETSIYADINHELRTTQQEQYLTSAIAAPRQDMVPVPPRPTRQITNHPTRQITNHLHQEHKHRHLPDLLI